MQNAVSMRTLRRNVLNSKMQPFRDNYDQSVKLAKSRTSLEHLAGSAYSSRNNIRFSPTKTSKRSVTLTESIQINPEQSNASMEALQIRAGHVKNLSNLNTDLIVEKRQLEERILSLKEKISKETRLKSKVEESCGKLHHEINCAQNMLDSGTNRSKQLQQTIAELSESNFQSRKCINQLRHSNNLKQESIKEEKDWIDRLQNRVHIDKCEGLRTDKDRNIIKAQLLKEQRVMNCASVAIKELQQERAMVMLEINKFVSQNKV